MIRMKKEQLNDELTIVGLLLVMMFVCYYTITFNNKMTEAMKVAILLDQRLSHIEAENKKSEEVIDTYRDMVNSLNRELDSFEEVETLHKDLLRLDK